MRMMSTASDEDGAPEKWIRLSTPGGGATCEARSLTRVVVVAVVCLLMVAPTSALSTEALSSQLFILPLTHHNFSFLTPGVTYQPSLRNMPDLPSWLCYSYSPAVHTGFVYGTPPEDITDFQVEVVARDQHTYETSHRVFPVDVIKQPRKEYEVRFKIQNMNVEDLLVGGRWDRLDKVMTTHVWPKAGDLIVTSLSSATALGDRLPPSPNAKEGVYVTYGSSVEFPQSLRELEKEAMPLWDHHPCPVYFKRTSYERFFRQQSFAIDWCSFKLHDHKKQDGGPGRESGESSAGHKSPVISALENEGRIYLQRKDQIEKRTYTFDVVHTILIPLVVMLTLLGLLTLAMCCHRDNMIPTGQDIQMVQYASLQRATDVLRSLKGREHSPHPSTTTTTTQVDTLTRSRTASPSSTLPRNSSVSRRFEDYATLSRPDPPPYQRNSTTPTR